MFQARSGAGKTVLLQITGRHAEVDIAGIIAACGERANEVVETIKEFPVLSDLLQQFPNGIDSHNMQQLNACGSKGGINIYRRYNSRILQADGLSCSSDSRFHIPLGTGHKGDQEGLRKFPGEEAFSLYYLNL